MQERSTLSYPSRWLMTFLVAAGLMISVWSLGRMALIAWAQIPARYDLIYECQSLGIVQMIKAHQNIYHPDVYERREFVINPHTPAYHYLVAAVPFPTDRPFLPGRLISASFMTLAACLVFVIGRRRSTWFVPILALGCFFSFRGVIASTSNFRMDSMALFFSASAVVLLGTRERGIGRVLLAAACGCLAIFTKQPSFAGLVSGFIFLAAVDRRNARIFALASGAILVAGGLFAQFYWGSGFWFCTLVVPQMPVMWKQFARLWVIVFHQPPALFVMAATGVVTAHSIYRHRWRVLLDSPYLIYLVVSTAVLMATVGKAGSALNYFVEPFLACLLWLTFALDDPDWSRGRNLAPSLAIALLCFCECVELAVIHPPEYYLQREHARSSEELLDRIRHEFESLGVREPRVLNVSRVVWQPLERMQEAYLEPRFVALNDSFLYNFVWGAGMVSPEPLRDAVMRREFDVVLVPRGLVIDDSTPRHLRRVVEAVRTRYLFTRSGVYDYYLKGSLNLNGSVNSVSQ